MTTDFVCPRSDCGNKWSMKSDKHGLFDGYGLPPCPVCGTNGSEASDYRDWECPSRHGWRVYDNGGLVLGMVPRCPQCDALPAHA